MPPEEHQETLGHRFSQPALLAEALTHASTADSRVRSNERMEFLGDAVLGFVVCERLYERFPDLLEGELTKMKSAIVSRRSCAQISQRHGLDRMLVVGKGLAGADQAVPSSVAAAVFESLIAAIYLDAGLEPARAFILKCVEPLIDESAESAHQQNFKSVLQQFAQRFLPDPPQYKLLDEKGPDHAKAFLVGVRMGGRSFPEAWASSKKEAEQEAALSALLELGLAEREDETVRLADEPEQERVARALDGRAGG
ncbi:MAG: ribonuclease III [Planctomycetota bacterium]